MPEHHIRLVPLPLSVEGVSVPNPDGSFDVYINSNLPQQRRKDILEHELNHIRREHFYLDLPLQLMERQARGEHINPILHPPENQLPCFASPSSLSHFLETLLAQQHQQITDLYQY